MIAKCAFFISCVAAAYATAILESGVISPALFNSGIIAPALVNARIYTPGVLKSGVVAPGILTSGYVSSGLAYNDAPVISAPVAAVAPTDKYLQTHLSGQSDYRRSEPQYLENYSGVAPSTIAARSLVATPGSLANDKRATNVLSGSPHVNSGLLGAAPVSHNRGIASPIGIRNTGILAGPGTIKTLLK